MLIFELVFNAIVVMLKFLWGHVNGFLSCISTTLSFRCCCCWLKLFSVPHSEVYAGFRRGQIINTNLLFFCFLMRFLDSNLPPNPKVPCSNSLCNEVKASWTWMVKPFRHWYVFWRLLPANVLVYWLSCVFDLLSLCVWKECVCLCVCFSETGCHRHSCLIWCVP